MQRFGIPGSYGLAAFGAAVSIAACGETEASFTDIGDSGGASGSTKYVAPGSDASGTGGTVGGASSSKGGSPGHAGSLGHAGSGGSAAGSGGSAAGSGGGAMLPPVTFKCGGKQPNQAVITHFDAFMGDRWMSGNLDGGVYVYPAPLEPTAGEFLRFADQVKDLTGIGVWFGGCIDGSKFRGVRFTIAGNVGPSGTVQFYVVTNRDTIVNETASVGTCVPADPNDTWQSCRAPVVTLPVTSRATSHAIAWTAFKAGLPTVTTDGSDLIALQWSFDWEGDTTPYAAELIVDDLEFFTSDGAGGVGNDAAPDAPGSSGQSNH